MKKIDDDPALARQIFINSLGPAGYKYLCSVVAPKEPSTVEFSSILSKLETHLCPKVNSMLLLKDQIYELYSR